RPERQGRSSRARRPVLSALAVPSGDEGDLLSFSVAFADVAADTVTIDWDFGDGLVAVGENVTNAYIDDGTYTVTVTATDDDGGTDSLTGTAVIANVAPSITSSAPTTALEGSLYSYTPTVVDPGDEVFTWTLSPSAPAGMTIDAGGAIEWTPTYAQALVGSYSVTLTVEDDGPNSITDAQSWTITVDWLDTDGDGLPDEWENTNGFDPNDPNDAAGDPDADGLTNLDEFGQGTDPNVYDGPTEPIAIEPLTGDEVSSVTPDLVVENATDPQNDVLVYDFEVYSDSALTTLVTSATDVVETAVETEWKVDVILAENTEYWWRARASDPWVASAWTAAESFLVNEGNEAPEVPVLTFPTEGETVTVLQPEVVWQEASDIDGDAVTYDVEVYDAGGLLVDSTTGAVGDGSEGRWTLNLTLEEDTDYNWTARAVDEHGLAGDWAEPEDFFLSTDNGAPFGTMFVDPQNGASIATLSPTLVATEAEDPEGGALTYEFEVDVVPSFDGPDLVTATIAASGTGTVSWVLADDSIELPDNSLVHARVRAVDEGGVASVPDTIEFFVRGENDAPSVPVLVSPEDGSVLNGSTRFEVETPVDPEGDVVFVEFIFATDAELTNSIVVSEQIVASLEALTGWETAIDYEGTVYWSARAVDEVGAESDWAAPWSFSLGGEAGDDDDDDGGAGDGAGCDCQSSVSGEPASAAWLLLLLLPLYRRRR
ncbi:MAG: PKD domain-containing protein, partial [Deltaproteobacteria bacterium]|nr:PKD domain-containing protein [Deltaproteobacteria bacterium]